MIVFNTAGAAPASTVTAVLLSPDTAGVAAEPLTTVTTTANASGTWEFRGLMSQAQALATFGLANTFWQITEPQSGGADPTVWSVVVTGAPTASSLVSALTAQASPPATFGSSTTASSSDFPKPLAGQTSRFHRHEYPTLSTYAGGTAGKLKAQVIYEGWGNGQVLRRLWFALLTGVYNDLVPMDSGAFVSCYIDDDGETGTTPDWSVSIGEFLAAGFNGGVQVTNRNVQRTSSNTGADSGHPYNTGGWRRFFAGARKYMRLELAVPTTSPSTSIIAYSAASVDQLASAPSGPQSYYRIAEVSSAAWAGRTPLTVVDTATGTGLQGGAPIAGPVQLEHIQLAVQTAGGDAVLEGNIQVLVDNGDGNGYQALNGQETTGGEDWLLGSWGVGGSGDDILQGNTGAGTTWGRWYREDPIFARSAIKVVWWVGQPFQGSWADATIQVKAQAGLWFDNNPRSIRYYAPDPVNANALFFDDFVASVGALPSSKFTTGSGAAIQSATNNVFRYSGASYGSLISDTCRSATVTTTSGQATYTDAAAVATEAGRQIYSPNFPFGAYVQSVSGTTVTANTNATGSGSTSVQYGTLDSFVTLTSTELATTLPSNYWVEARMILNGVPPFYVGASEICLVALGQPDAHFANAAKVGLLQNTTQGGGTPVGGGALNPTFVEVKDAYNLVANEVPGTTPYNAGNGWAAQWFQVAAKVLGAGTAQARMYGYYRFDGELTWRPLSRHATAITGASPVIGVVAFTPMGAEVDWIRVRPLLTVSS